MSPKFFCICMCGTLSSLYTGGQDRRTDGATLWELRFPHYTYFPMLHCAYTPHAHLRLLAWATWEPPSCLVLAHIWPWDILDMCLCLEILQIPKQKLEKGEEEKKDMRHLMHKTKRKRQQACWCCSLFLLFYVCELHWQEQWGRQWQGHMPCVYVFLS